MPVVGTKAAASSQGFGEFAQSSAGAATYIEDVFSTYLYTGNNGTTQVVNGIDLSTNGGMVWIKPRSSPYNNTLQDTVRGVDKNLYSNSTSAQTSGGQLTSWNTNGFTISGTGSEYNANAVTYASWTFRKKAKFFDVVTYTGNGVAGRQIAHNLGSAPGCMIVKRYSTSGLWAVYHRSLTSANYYMELNTTAAQAANSGYWNNTAPTSTVFTVGNDGDVNGSGISYVAYLFAHNAGGFGLTGTDNVISCGSYTGGYPSSPSVNLGYEPQFVMVKNVTTAGYNWLIQDNMRGMPNSTASSGWAALHPNTGGSETNFYSLISPTSTGFIVDQNANGSGMVNISGNTYIYIAIRRGPMKVPTSGTSVFAPITYTGNGTVSNKTSGFAPDLFISRERTAVYSSDWPWIDKLRGTQPILFSNGVDAQYNDSTNSALQAFTNTGVTIGSGGAPVGSLTNSSGGSYVNYTFQRAPSFFDEVCYTGNGSTQNVSHNLTIAPELLIVKMRSSAGNWRTYAASQGVTKQAVLNATDQFDTAGVMWNNTTPTSSVFSVGADSEVNGSGQTYVAYLFATCAGVSKVGSYTGTGATQTISCGFTGGARFVLVKRTDSAGDWWIWDTARGMVSGTDPSLKFNTTAAEVNANSIYTTTGGFQIVSTAAGINASGGTYIFLAVA